MTDGEATSTVRRRADEPSSTRRCRTAASRGRRARHRRAAGGGARPVQGHRAAPAGRLRELPQAGRRAQAAEEVDRATGRLVEALLPVLDACEAAFAHGVDGVEPIWSALHRHPAEAGPRGHGPRRASRSTRPRPRPSLHEPRATSRRARRGRGAAHRLPLEGPGAAPGHGEGEGLHGPAAGVVREGLLQGPRACPDRRLGQGRSPRPTASWPASTTPTPTPTTRAAEERFKEISAAYDVVGDEDKRKEYDEVRKLGPMGGAASARRARRPGGQGFRSRSTTATIGDLLGGLFGRGRRAAAPAPPDAASGRGGATTSRPSCTLSFTDAVHGVTTDAVPHLGRRVLAPATARGAKPGTSPASLPRRAGAGA